MFFHRANAARAQEMVWRVTSPKRAEISAAFIVEHASKVHFLCLEGVCIIIRMNWILIIF